MQYSVHGCCRRSYQYRSRYAPLLLSAAKDLPEQGSDDSADQRTNDEYPYNLQGVSSEKKRRSEGTGRVDAGSGEEDSKEMYQSQRSADDQSRDMAVLDLGSCAEHCKYEDAGENDLDDE